jgi:NAD(P)H-nitrite reductase large subunit
METKNHINRIKETVDYAIIGNSAAGLAAAESIRELDKTGKILIFSEEKYRNYSKPLITYFLEGAVSADKIHFKSNNFYRNNNIDIRQGTVVKSVDTKKMFLTCGDGLRYEFGKLLIAGGGRPIIPEIKAVCNNTDNSKSGKADDSSTYINSGNYGETEGIFTLTTLSDAFKIKDFIGENNITEISILGGGLIGLKSAEAFLKMGMTVNIIEIADRILSATFDRQASDIIEKRITDRGSNIYKNNTIEEIFMTNKKISGCRLKDGKRIECRMLVIAIGVVPNTGFIKNGAPEINRGIIVNSHMCTSVKNIYAAGDVAEATDILSERKRNIAIWPLAVKQGTIAGINMAGGDKKYSGGFFMNSVEILGIPTISMGLAGIDEKECKIFEIYKDFNPEKNTYKKVVIRNNKIIGLIMVGNIERAGIYAGLIQNEIDVNGVKDNISREDFGIVNLPVDYKKHLVSGEGIEI